MAPPPLPPASTIEKALKDAVYGDLASRTMREVRADAARNLGLAENFFKTSADWNARSKKVVREETDRQEAMRADGGVGGVGGVGALSGIDTVKPKAKSAQSPEGKLKTGAKRKTPDDNFEPSKRHKVARTAEDPGSRQAATGSVSSDELSDFVDEEPVRKKPGKRKSSGNPAKTEKEKAKPAAKAKGETEMSPDDEEIKRLKGQLRQCGIRKFWHTELAPYGTPKAKIARLRQMLKDAGMDGRFSSDKARAIKEKRELEADLEAVTAGNERWGHESALEEDGNAGPRPKRKLAKGMEELRKLEEQLGFLGDEEESD